MSTMEALRRALVTEAEFLALPESSGKVELIDGEVNVAPAPSFRHQTILKNLVFALESWARSAGVGAVVGQSPVDIRFQPNRILQPDAFVLFDEVSLDHQGPLDTVPALCVEVLSTDRVYDRVTKRLVYGAAGVAELWIVEQSGLVERWHGEGLAQVEEIDDRLRSPLLPGFVLEVASLVR